MEMRLSLTFRDCRDRGSAWLSASRTQRLAPVSPRPRGDGFSARHKEQMSVTGDLFFLEIIFFICFHIIYLNKHKANAFYSHVVQKTDPGNFFTAAQGFIRLFGVNLLDYIAVPKVKGKMHLKTLNTETI